MIDKRQQGLYSVKLNDVARFSCPASGSDPLACERVQLYPIRGEERRPTSLRLRGTCASPRAERRLEG